MWPTGFVEDKVLLEISKITVERGGVALFHELSSVLEPGTLLQVVGPNGAGKTTLLLAVAGLLPLAAGRILWNRKEVRQNTEEFARNMSYLGHAPGLKSALDPLENLAFLLALRQQPLAQARLIEALLRVGLHGYERTPVGQLSAGQRRRVALARLYLEQSVLWILDEPFTAIDLHGVEQLEHLLVDHAHNGGIVLFTTHHRLQDTDTLTVLDLRQWSSAVHPDEVR